MLTSFWHSWRRRRDGAPSPRIVRRCRPTLESLEGRWLPSPITKVQDLGTAALSDASSTSLVIPVTTSRPMAVGDRIIVALFVGFNPDVTTSVSDTKGNTYQLDAQLAPGRFEPFTEVFSAAVTTPLTGLDDISISFSGAENAGGASAAEFAGLAPNPRDAVSSNSGSTAAVSSGPTGLTAQANELLLGAVGAGASASSAGQPPPPPTITFTPGAGYVALASAAGTEPANSGGNFLSFTDAIEPEFRLVRATGTYVADGTLASSSGTNPSWEAAIVTYAALDQTAQFRVTASAASVRPGAPLTVTVTALDAGGAVSTHYTGIVHLSSSDPAAGLPPDYTFTAADQGSHTFTVTPHSIGRQAITASDTNPAAGFSASASVSVVSPVPPTRYHFTARRTRFGEQLIVHNSQRVVFRVVPFPHFFGRLFAASGDVNHDGRADVIVGQGSGGQGAVLVLSGVSHRPLARFRPPHVGRAGLSSLAAKDVNGDGFADVFVGLPQHHPRLKVVFDGKLLLSGHARIIKTILVHF